MRQRNVVGFVVLLTVAVALAITLGRLTAQRTPVDPEVVDATDYRLDIRVYDRDRDEIRTMPLGEYLKGVVAAEMPPEFHDQALMAQMIVARTYAASRMRPFAHPAYQSCHPDADICADVSNQAYLSYDDMVKRYGDWAAQAYWQRLDEVQKATGGIVVRYNGKLVDTLYHAVSGTSTVDSGEYFGESQPYLKAVDDSWGANAPRLTGTVRIALGELAAKVSRDDQVIPASALTSRDTPIEITARTTTGRVKVVNVGGVEMSGREFRERLGLRSTDFTVQVTDGEAVITTTGNGHGVGMSQYGANGMAMAGKTYEQILTHYYTGITIAHLLQE